MGEDLIHSLIFLFALEEGFRGKQDIQNDSTAPEIAFGSKVPSDYLRSNITHSSHQAVAFGLGLCHLIGSPEVYKLYLYILEIRLVSDLVNEDNVFKFDISVDYQKAV